MMRAEVGLEFGRAGPGAEEVFILEERIERAQAQAEEDAAGKGSAFFAGDQNVGARRALRELQVLVLVHDELPAQRNHEEHSEKAADQRQHEDAGVFEVEAEKNKCGKRKDDAGGDGLARVAGGLDDDVLKNRRTAEGAQIC